MTLNSSSGGPLDFTTFYNVIDGRFDNPKATRHTINPSSLENNPEVPLSTPTDVHAAVQAAQRAAKLWAEVPWSERKKALESFAVALESYTEDFAQMLIKEQGKPPFWARNEIATGVQFLRGFCELSLPTEIIEDTQERSVTTHYTPLGVTVGIVPWNFPIFLACGKIGPALLTGNAFILKASPFTPYCSLKLAELGLRFFPPGVFQALSGDDHLGPWLIEHPDINMISFTGSVPNGKKVIRACSETLKRVTLELGGNDPAIVCANVDPVTVASKIALFAFCNSGQMCMSIKRVYVHESVYDQVLDTVVQYVKALELGVDEKSFVGPISNNNHFEYVKGLLANIEKNQLTIATGGTKLLADGKGFLLPPTIINNPPDNSQIVSQEQFGPVLPLLKWSEESDVIQRANSTDTGLGASVWTRDDAQAARIAKQLQAGNVWINTHAEIQANTPFGGCKQSGNGVEWGVEGLKAYCSHQSVYTRSLP
ncbi:aldehyde dehydrogenase [Hypoxylon fuscum]|nr:aldehyde dehydrogenase [Hypoxylon fuscum]